MITQELLNQNFYYKNGGLYWIADRNYRAKKDQKAGSLGTGHRYWHIQIKQKNS